MSFIRSICLGLGCSCKSSMTTAMFGDGLLKTAPWEGLDQTRSISAPGNCDQSSHRSRIQFRATLTTLRSIGGILQPAAIRIYKKKKKGDWRWLDVSVSCNKCLWPHSWDSNFVYISYYFGFGCWLRCPLPFGSLQLRFLPLVSFCFFPHFSFPSQLIWRFSNTVLH